MNKRNYVISALIIWSMLYSLAIGPGGGPGGAIQAEGDRIVVLADDWPICSDTPFEIANEPTAEGDTQWNRTYDVVGFGAVWTGIQTVDGGFALAGHAFSSGTDSIDAWLMKTDASGTMEWQQTYGGANWDLAYAMIQTADGGFALAGWTESSGTSHSDFWLVKTDAHGEMEWQQTYGGSEGDVANAVIQTVDGGFALAGYTRSFGAGGNDAWLMKTNAHREVEWQQTYGGGADDEAYAVIQTTDGGFALFYAGGADSWLVKIDAHGNQEWQQTYDGWVRAGIQTADGGFALAGGISSSGAGHSDFWLVKTDAHGEVEWEQTYGGGEGDVLHAVIQTADGGFALAGDIWSGGKYSSRADAWLVKTDAHGEMEWQQIYSGSKGHYASAVIQTTDGGLALAGYTFATSQSPGPGGAWLVKTFLPWHPRAPMPTPRADLAVAVVNERVYAIGGFNGIQNLATMEEYDPATDTWRSRAPMPTARGWLAATAVNGKIYALGGWDGTNYLSTVEEYDPTTNIWRSRAPMPTHRYGLAVVAVGGRIYAIGGQNEIAEGYQKTVEEYDPATNTWRPRADMATCRYGLAAGVVQGRIYALGGFNAANRAMKTVEEYNPILNTWRGVADKPTAQISLAAGAVGGRLYAIGGLETNPSPVEEYDPLTDTWESRIPLPTPRAGLAAAVVRGRLYAIGGYDGNRRLSTVEEYDPPFYDTDGDGFADDEELRYGRDPLVPEPATETDTDGDGLPDIEEVTKYGTNPWVPDIEADTDGDGLTNVAEVDRYRTNATVADTDRDGLGDGVEVLTYKTNPLVTDTDMDDLTDGEEVTTYETNPTVADTDGDGLFDGEEVLTYETNPLVVDTDEDTYSDGAEVAAGTNPQDPAEYPSTTTGTATDTATTDAHGTVEWQQTYGGAEGDAAYAVIQTTDGGFALAGWTESYGAGDADFYLVKTDAHGTMEWQQRYGGAESEWARTGIQTMDGGFALAGFTTSFGVGWYDFYLVKTDAHGTMEWQQTYGGAGEESARAVIQTADGGFVLAGFTTSIGAGGRDGWLVKTDAHGTVEWNQTYGGAEGDEAYAVIQTADGGFALAGVTSSFGTGDPDIWLVKTNAGGELLWTRTYGGSENDVAFSAIQMADGGFALAGYTMSFGTGDPDIWLVKTDIYGEMDWQRTYGGVGYDVAWAMIQTADSGFALAGKTEGKTAVIYLSGDFWLVKTDAHGTVEWQQTYGGAEGNQAYAVIQTADDGFALTGVTESNGAGGRDAWLVKTIPPEITPPELSATTSTTTGTVTGTTTDTATTDTPAAFIPGFTLVELVLALACLVVLARRKTKQ
ncbi:MAG: kelch repeat-containing protein [Candidatus Heimdallarchaeota archaeon]